MSLRLAYQNRILENHQADIHKDKIRNVQTDRQTWIQNKWGVIQANPESKHYLVS